MLREDGVSHNGTPLTAEVMKFSFDLIAASDTQSRLAASLLGPYNYTEIVVDVIEEVPLGDVARLESDETKIVASAGSADAPCSMVLNQLREPWGDVRARRDFRAALDIDRIVAVVDPTIRRPVAA